MKQETVLDHAVVVLTDDGCYSTFADGTSWGAQPHDTPHYDTIARRCGYGAQLPTGSDTAATLAAKARMAYCREHEVFHHIVGAVFFFGPSPVLWKLAHGQPVDEKYAALEEAMVMTLQRWVRAGERPIIGGVDWDGIKSQALQLLDG